MRDENIPATGEAGSRGARRLDRRGPRQPLGRTIYEQLRTRIFSGELKPGARLSPPRLAKAFGVSTMPVREALRALDEEGLIDVAPRKWTRVAAPDPRVLDEIYPLLAVLEPFAVATAPSVPIEVITSAKRANEELSEAAARHDVLGCTQADDRFHEALISMSTNRTLRETIASLKARTHLLESAYYRIDDASTSVRQHSEIIDALMHDDLDRASAIVARNWRMGQAKLRAALAGS